MRVLVTGANGFVGGALVQRLVADGDIEVWGAVRDRSATPPSNVRLVEVGDLGRETDFSDALHGIDVVIHTAARVHVMRDTVADPLDAFRRINVVGTTRLARQAALAGVRRFVFVSSIKVNGEGTTDGHPYTPDDPPAPADPYGVSKAEAEEALRRIGRDTGLEVVIVRPVLVYGPGVRGNFASLVRWLKRGVPLPLGAIHNRRSLVALDNLVDFLALTARHRDAANRTFLVSDGEDLATTDLLRRTAAALGVRPKLLPVPARLLEVAGTVFGRRDVVRRLCGSLQVSIAATRATLGWSPPVGVDDALRRMVAANAGSDRR